jgi:hypothetical protein
MKAPQRMMSAASLLLALSLACNLPSQLPTSTPELSLVLSQTALARATVHTSTPLTPAAGLTQTPSLPPTATLTITPSTPMVSVSVNTNCRSGPGVVYDLIGALVVGEKAVVVGKYSPTNYWIINNPDRTGTCWLWGEYATVTGNTAGLPEFTPPPTPTPSITPSPTVTVTPALPAAPSNLSYSASCTPPPLVVFLGATLSWQDNSNNEDGFRIYRSGTLAATVGPNTTTYAVTSAGIYAVEAYNAFGTSSRVETTVACP